MRAPPGVGFVVAAQLTTGRKLAAAPRRLSHVYGSIVSNT